MLSLSAHVIRLMDDLYLPDLFRVHTTLGFARDAQVHTLIRYADTVLNRRPLDWVLDMVSTCTSLRCSLRIAPFWVQMRAAGLSRASI